MSKILSQARMSKIVSQDCMRMILSQARMCKIVSARSEV